jgi:hypothetical protein
MDKQSYRSTSNAGNPRWDRWANYYEFVRKAVRVRTEGQWRNGVIWGVQVGNTGSPEFMVLLPNKKLVVVDFRALRVCDAESIVNAAHGIEPHQEISRKKIESPVTGLLDL